MADTRNLKDFHYTVTGKKGAPWVIFLHGLLGSSRNWLKILPDFEKNHQVLNLDQRGHGKSMCPKTGYTPMDFAEDVHFLIHELKMEAATVIGHSMGGRNALMLAHAYPNHVSKLVIEDIGPESTYEAGFGLLARLKKVPVPFKDKKAAKEYLLNEFDDPQLGNFLYTRINNDADWDFPMSMVEEILREGRGRDLWEEVRSLQCPTLVVRGELSQELKPDEYQRMLSINPNIRGEVISGTGHWIHFEKPKEFSSAVLKFLNQP